MTRKLGVLVLMHSSPWWRGLVEGTESFRANPASPESRWKYRKETDRRRKTKIQAGTEVEPVREED